MPKHNNKLLILLLLCLTGIIPALADMPRNNSPEELERWLNSDDDKSWNPNDVNEGKLHFLTKLPKQPPHVADNRIKILPSSLESGWVQLDQCHTRIDAMPLAQIVYRTQPVRKLMIKTKKNIKTARVEGNTVQLKNIQPGASICIQAEIRALYSKNKHQYELITGPYQRRFLDGFYPVSLSLHVSYPENLQLDNMVPARQPGYTVLHKNRQISVTSLFEGRLFTHFSFLNTPALKK